jgi:hypothetical protein
MRRRPLYVASRQTMRRAGRPIRRHGRPRPQQEWPVFVPCFARRECAGSGCTGAAAPRPAPTCAGCCSASINPAAHREEHPWLSAHGSAAVRPRRPCRQRGVCLPSPGRPAVRKGARAGLAWVKRTPVLVAAGTRGVAAGRCGRLRVLAPPLRPEGIAVRDCRPRGPAGARSGPAGQAQAKAGGRGRASRVGGRAQREGAA